MAEKFNIEEVNEKLTKTFSNALKDKGYNIKITPSCWKAEKEGIEIIADNIIELIELISFVENLK